MAIPASTVIWAEPMDPYDIMDYAIDCSGLLEEDEAIASYTVTVLSESSLLGLQLNDSGGYSTQLSGSIIVMWLSIDPAEQQNTAFTAGVTLPLEINIVTNSTPPRRRQRTVAVKVVQR